MGLLEQQNFLAKLYTDEVFRNNFIENPNELGNQNGLSEQEIFEIKKILPDEIIAFANSLFYKRLREVEKFLPLTKKVLKNDFEKCFREFIKKFNPKSVKKHFEDSIEYARYLQEQELLSDLVKDISKYELGKLEFTIKNFIVKKFSFDLRKIRSDDLFNDPNSRKKVRFIIWLRIKNYQRVLFINLPFNL